MKTSDTLPVKMWLNLLPVVVKHIPLLFVGSLFIRRYPCGLHTRLKLVLVFCDVPQYRMIVPLWLRELAGGDTHCMQLR